MPFTRIGLAAVALVALTLPTSAAAETVVDLTPEGPEFCCDDPDYGVKGYRFTVTQTFTAYAGEWLLELPAGSTMAARVRGVDDELLAEGSIAEGDGTEQWYASELEFTFEAGLTYEVDFFLDAPNEASFRRKTGDYSGYDVPPYLVDLESRSRYGEDDGPTTTYNSWPPFMRLVLDAPDTDADGVADPDDACPDAPAEPPDADGDGCTDPPPSTDSSGDNDDGSTSNAPDDDAETMMADDSSDGSNPGSTDATSVSDPAADSGADSSGCSISTRETGAAALPWLAAILLFTNRERRGRARRARRT